MAATRIPTLDIKDSQIVTDSGIREPDLDNCTIKTKSDPLAQITVEKSKSTLPNWFASHVRNMLARVVHQLEGRNGRQHETAKLRRLQLDAEACVASIREITTDCGACLSVDDQRNLAKTVDALNWITSTLPSQITNHRGGKATVRRTTTAATSAESIGGGIHTVKIFRYAHFDQQLLTASASWVVDQPIDYIDMDQAAALINRQKKTLERKLKAGRMPQPDVRGRGGKKHEWVYAKLKPWLEEESEKFMPPRPPHALR